MSSGALPNSRRSRRVRSTLRWSTSGRRSQRTPTPLKRVRRSSRRRSDASISPGARSSRRLGRGDPRPSALGRCGKTSRGRDRVHEGRRREPTLRLVEPYTIERELPVWRVHTWDRSVDAARTFRLDRMRSARLTNDHFDARDGFDPSYLRDPRVARLLHSPDVARWKLERGARALTDGSAIADIPYKTEEWLLSEVLADAARRSSSSHSAFATSWRRARRLQRGLGRVPSRR